MSCIELNVYCYFNKFMHIITIFFYCQFLWIHWLLVSNNKRFVDDIARWKNWKSISNKSRYVLFVILMSDYPEFRNICYYRMGKMQYLVRWLCPPVDTLFIRCPNIGGGLLIEHGFATIIQAEKIGSNAKIFQQVTIGYNEDKRPILGDNVEVWCGANVIGGVHVGNNVTIGAQALVIKDVEDNVVVGGVPAKVIKRKL